MPTRKTKKDDTALPEKGKSLENFNPLTWL